MIMDKITHVVVVMHQEKVYGFHSQTDAQAWLDAQPQQHVWGCYYPVPLSTPEVPTHG